MGDPGTWAVLVTAVSGLATAIGGAIVQLRRQRPDVELQSENDQLTKDLSLARRFIRALQARLSEHGIEEPPDPRDAEEGP